MADRPRDQLIALALLALVVLAPALGGCRNGDVADPDAAPPAAESPATGGMALADLPEGPLPAIDVVLGSTLVHDGTQYDLQGWPGRTTFAAIGTFDDRPVVEVVGDRGSQFVTVADDGTTEPLGEPYESYNYPARLVAGSGHLLTFLSDRDSGRLTTTVLDASTGSVLSVLQSGDDLGSLDPADRTVVEVLTGLRRPPPRLRAVSPDGSVEITIRSGPDRPAVLVVAPTDESTDGTILRFRGEAGDLAFESDATFLVAIAERDVVSQPLVRVVVRCTVDGACERTTQPSRDVTIAGSEGVHFSPR